MSFRRSRPEEEWHGYPDLTEADAVFMSFARLSRNLKDLPFPASNRANGPKVVAAVAAALAAEIPHYREKPLRGEMPGFAALLDVPAPRGSAAKADEEGPVTFRVPSLGALIVVNNVDHLSIQGVTSGTDLARAYATADALETALSKHLAFAWDPTLGYLTAEPDSVGTGLHAGALLHLEGLHLIGELEPSLRGVEALKLVACGIEAGGIRHAGHLFQVVNSATLGLSEVDLVAQMKRVVDALVEQELNARLRLVDEMPRVLGDAIGRSLAILKEARLLSAAEIVDLLSPLRLAATMGFLDNLSTAEADMLLTTQPVGAPEEKDQDARDRADGARADLMNVRFAKVRMNAHGKEFLS